MSDVQITETNFHAFKDLPDRWLELTEDKLVYSALHGIIIVGSISSSIVYAYLNHDTMGPGTSSASTWIILVVMSLLPQAICACITGFMAIGVLKAINKALGKPMNLPAIAAIAGGLSLVATIGIPLATKHAIWSFGGTEASSLGIDTVLLIWVNAFIIQFFVRLWVAGKIEKHNQKPYALKYSCPTCHKNFQIWQMMVGTTIIAVFLAIASAIGFAETIHVMIPTLTQDQVETQLEQNSVAKPASFRPDKFYLDAPVKTLKATFEGTPGIAIAGMHFAIVFTIMLSTSSIIGNGNVNGVGPFLAFPGAFVGLILAGVCGLIVTIVVAGLNSFIGNRISAGHVAAAAGGLSGFACSLMIVEGWRLLHWSPSTGFYDLHDFNNLFPLVAIFIATAMGQIYARVKVKRSLLALRHSPITLLPSDQPDYYIFMQIAMIVGCMAMAWPLGCWVARLVDQRWSWES